MNQGIRDIMLATIIVIGGLTLLMLFPDHMMLLAALVFGILMVLSAIMFVAFILSSFRR